MPTLKNIYDCLSDNEELRCGNFYGLSFLTDIIIILTMKLSSLLSLATKVAAVTISVSKDGGKDASRLQYGLMFEEINFSGDGGM